MHTDTQIDVHAGSRYVRFGLGLAWRLGRETDNMLLHRPRPLRRGRGGVGKGLQSGPRSADQMPNVIARPKRGADLGFNSDQTDYQLPPGSGDCNIAPLWKGRLVGILNGFDILYGFDIL